MEHKKRKYCYFAGGNCGYHALIENRPLHGRLSGVVCRCCCCLSAAAKCHKEHNDNTQDKTRVCVDVGLNGVGWCWPVSKIAIPIRQSTLTRSNSWRTLIRSGKIHPSTFRFCIENKFFCVAKQLLKLLQELVFMLIYTPSRCTYISL